MPIMRVPSYRRGRASHGVAVPRRLAQGYYAIIEYYISLLVLLLPFGGKRRTPRT